MSTAHHGHAARRTNRRAVVTVPLILLAIPSVCAGWLIGPMSVRRLLRQLDRRRAAAPGAGEAGARSSTASSAMMLHGFDTLPFWLALAGVAHRLVSLHRAPRSAGGAARASPACW